MNKDKYNEILNKVIGREYKKFLEMCPQDQQPILSILRSHLLSEYYLEQIINLELLRGDKLLSDGNLSYRQKLSLVEALNVLSDASVQSLRSLNRIRNGCAHEMDREITLADIDRIGRPFGSEYTKAKRDYQDNISHLIHEVVNFICRELVSTIFAIEQDHLLTLEKAESRDVNK